MNDRSVDQDAIRRFAEGQTVQTASSAKRAERRRERTRSRLMEAGRRIFFTRGVREASIAEITAAADVGTGTFYLHFANKEELFLALLREGLSEMVADLDRVAETLTPGEQLAALVRVLFQGAAKQRDLALLALSEVCEYPMDLDFRSVLSDRLSRILHVADDAGQLAGESPELLAHQIGGVLLQSMVWWFEQETVSADAIVEQVLRLLRRGLPAGVMAGDDSEDER